MNGPAILAYVMTLSAWELTRRNLRLETLAQTSRRVRLAGALDTFETMLSDDEIALANEVCG